MERIPPASIEMDASLKDKYFNRTALKLAIDRGDRAECVTILYSDSMKHRSHDRNIHTCNHTTLLRVFVFVEVL